MKENTKNLKPKESKQKQNDIHYLPTRYNEDKKTPDLYDRYKIDDDDEFSEFDNEDIQTKMFRLINMKKENPNFIQFEKNKLEKMKETSKKFQKKKETKTQERLEKNKEKINKGIIKFSESFVKILKKYVFNKIKLKQNKKKPTNEQLTKAINILINFKNNYNKNRTKKIFRDFFNFYKIVKPKKPILKQDKINELKKAYTKEETKEGKKALEEKIIQSKSKKEVTKVNFEAPNKTKAITDSNKEIIDPKLALNYQKVSAKKKKLEFLHKRQEEYLRIIEQQRYQKQRQIIDLNNQIKSQINKCNKLIKGEEIASSEGGASELNKGLEDIRFINALALLEFVIKNNQAKKKLDTLYFLIDKFVPLTTQKLKGIDRKQSIESKNKERSILKKATKKTSTFEHKEDEEEMDKAYIKRLTKKISTIMVEKTANRNLAKEMQMAVGEEERGSEKITEEEDTQFDDTFIKLKEDTDLEKPVDSSQLVEYDLFYKEQFFKNEVFKYDVNNIQDKEVSEINKEMAKLDLKRRLVEKKKLKEVNDIKGIDTTELAEEIKGMQKKYDDMKKVEEPKVEMIMNNTEGFLTKGRILGFYFSGDSSNTFPRFAMESEMESGGKEVIDFKVLRKEEIARRYFDYCCCLEKRKKINKFFVYARFGCRFFVDNLIFDNISLAVIIANTILILISDPTDSNNLGNTTDNYFLYFYTVEAVLKIIAFRFITAEDAYLKDYWNILDFFVVIVGWISFILERVMNGKKISGLAGLRAFRILRPLKTVKRFKGLKKLVTALLASIGHLGETSIVLVFFFLLFAIAGTQMWQGNFYRRCMNLNFGFLASTMGDKSMCTFDSDCTDLDSYGSRFICAKGYRNPDSGAVNFDNTLTGFVTVFVMVTLEGWTSIFTYVNKTFKDKIYINPIIVFAFFHAYVFMGGFYLINLFLAVTNSEFEHIEKSRRELSEKKSFYILIKTKYDKKEKEKKEKKEKEKLLRQANSKKSDEALLEKYYKVVDEAFHINRNKRNIPIIYSTVKDMYIMSNNNPEELYLQNLRIEEEEKLLKKDIKRQQKEIDQAIDEKRKEMKKLEKEKALEDKEKENQKKGPTIERATTLNEKKKESSKELKEKSNKIKLTKSSKMLIDKNNLAAVIQSINPDIIDFSIDYTQKFFKEKMTQIQRDLSKNKSKDKKKLTKKDLEKVIMNQLTLLEDLPYEKKDKIKIQRKNEKEKTKKSINDKKKRIRNGLAQVSSSKNIRLSSGGGSGPYRKGVSSSLDGSDKEELTKELSVLDELSLSGLNDSFEGEEEKKRIKKSFSRQNSRFSKLNTLLKKPTKEEGKNNVAPSEEGNQSLASNDFIEDEKEDTIIGEKKIMIDLENNIGVESKFTKPGSVLNSIIKINNDHENEILYDRKRKKFKLKEYLKEEKKKGVKLNTLGRKYSFLDFLQYTQKPENLEKVLEENKEIFENSKDNDSINNIKLIKDENIYENEKDDENLVDEKSFLSKGSDLSYLNNISLDDIKLLPQDMKDNKIYSRGGITMEIVNKNMESNKLTQLIRNSLFDRQSVNTNINLTSTEQSKYYAKMNKKLNSLLYADNRKVRGRKKNDLNVSHIKEEKDYEDVLKAEEQAEEIIEYTDNNEGNTGNNKSTIEEKDFFNQEEEEYKEITSEKNLISSREIKLNQVEEVRDTYENLISGQRTKTARRNLNEGKLMKNIKSGNNLLSSISDKHNSSAGLLNGEKSLGVSEALKNLESNNNLGQNTNNNINFDEEFNETKNNNKKMTTLRKKKNQNDNDLNDKNKVGTNSNKKKGGFFLFKAKSIEKNNDKYPVENTNKFLVQEENAPYHDPLTVKQELIPDNLRGKKYYLNYLYNIADKDLKVKDNFKVDHWVREILGRKDKYIKLKKLPESSEAFFVFNDKKLNLKKYTYEYHKDIEYTEKEMAFLTNGLKYLPMSCLEIMPLRLRDFGKNAVGKELNTGTISIKPTAMFPVGIGANLLTSGYQTRSGKTSTVNQRNKTNLITSSAFINCHKIEEDIKFRRNIYERIYKKIDELNYRTLSHYFLEEEKFYQKFLDPKKKAEVLSEIEEKNKKKQNRLEVKSEIENIKIFDIKSNSRRYVQWSGADVLFHLDEDKNKKKWNHIISSLEDFNMIIWHKNDAIQKLQKVRYAFYVLATNDYFDFIILAIVIINSVFMALDGNILKPEVNNNLNISNYVFNSIFILEYVVKFIGLGPLVYYSDAFTYLDTLIIAMAILDMCTPSDTNTDTLGSKKSVSSSLSFLRVFRIFRVIRLTKVLRRMKSMRLIIVSIKKALSSVSYIVCILVMFILIFELLGMSLLSGNFHYQSFMEGFFTTYQILTLENWNSLLYELWPMSYFCFFYFVAWIFLGNYIIFNLFISILLQSFGEDNEEDEDDLSEDEKIERMFELPDYLRVIKRGKKKEGEEILQTKKKKIQLEEGADAMNASDMGNQSREISKSKMSASNMNVTGESSESEKDESSGENDGEDNGRQLYGIEKNIKEWQKINKLFRKNECENSIYVFSQTNNFRIFCMKLMSNKWFDKFILVMILCSTARLIIDTFVSGYEFVLAFDVLDAIFNIIFLLEALCKVFALGFAMDEGSYIRDNWNKIDIIIVVCSFFDFQNLFTKYFTSGNANSSVQFLKVIRLLRTLRPLRFISHNVQLKLIITSLFDSILPICNALFIVLVVYYIFSIVGISLFYSSLHNCYVLENGGFFGLAIEAFDKSLLDYNINNDMPSISTFCASKYNGIMDTGPAFKFSNIVNAIITSYVLSTMEGWPDIMKSYNIYSNYYGFFFVVFNIVVAYFFLNLFTGIMFKYFNEAFQREQKIAEDDKKAPKYYDFLTQITSSQTHYIVWVKPENGTFRYYLREFADSNFLDNFIMIVIFLNMIIMALNYEGNSAPFNNALTIINYIFTCIFIAEMLIKLSAYGFKAYFHVAWNRFDFFVVIASIVDWVVANIDGIDASFLKSFQIIRVLRVLRVTRVLRLVKSLKGLEKLIQTLSWSLKALANVLLLMLIIFCIFAILGCYFYDAITYENYKGKLIYINQYYNFDNFYQAFLLVFRCATGENWNAMMMEMAFIDTKKVAEAYSYVFFIISNFVTAIIMLNLFLMVTLQQYDEFTNKNYNPIEKFESFLSEFNSAWNKFATEEDEGFRIKKVLVTQFFMELNWRKLNFPEQGKLEYIKKYVSELKLRTDGEDNVYYLDVIQKIITKQMGSQIDRANPDNQLILKTEKKLQEEIRQMINKYIYKKSGKKRKDGSSPLITFNPLTSHLYFKVSYLYFKTYINFYKENQEVLNQVNNEENIADDISKERPSNNNLAQVENDSSAGDNEENNSGKRRKSSLISLENKPLNSSGRETKKVKQS